MRVIIHAYFLGIETYYPSLLYFTIILTAYHNVHVILIIHDKPQQRIHLSIATKDLFKEKAGSKCTDFGTFGTHLTCDVLATSMNESDRDW